MPLPDSGIASIGAKGQSAPHNRKVREKIGGKHRKSGKFEKFKSEWRQCGKIKRKSSHLVLLTGRAGYTNENTLLMCSDTLKPSLVACKFRGFRSSYKIYHGLWDSSSRLKVLMGGQMVKGKKKRKINKQTTNKIKGTKKSYLLYFYLCWSGKYMLLAAGCTSIHKLEIF